MLSAKHVNTIGSTGQLLLWLVLGSSGCGADTTTFSSSSNWLSCRTDAECKAAFGEGSCSSQRICVDANNEPIPRDRRSSEARDTDVGEVSRDTSRSNDAALSGLDAQDASVADAGSAGSTQADAGTSDEGATLPDAESGATDAGHTDTQALCSSTCNQTDPYVLPLALCEDWNVFRDGQSYEFCDPLPSGTCEERCNDDLTRTSPACAEVLPAAISCVAADGLYDDVTIPLPSGCLFPACQVQLLHMASACSRLYEDWQAATERWLQSGITAYRFQLGASTIQVDGTNATVVAGEPLDSTPTIEDLFATVESSLTTPERPMIVTYDPMFGYPTRLRNYALGGAENCAIATETLISEFTID
jgi:Family of unknown function (DUF6174)